MTKTARSMRCLLGAAAAILALQAALFAQAPEDVTIRLFGRVFADANGNGKCDEGEKGIPGVRVSDFWTSAVTDAEGRYDFRGTVKRSLDPPEIPVVYVTLPAGFSVHHSRDFYRYVDWKDRKEFETDFGLKPDPATLEKDFCWVASGDGKYEDTMHWLTPLMNAMDRKPRFLMTCGDTFLGSWGENNLKDLTAKCGDGAMDELRRRTNALVDQLNVPTFNAMGNHDVPWQSVFGPGCYSFNWGGVRFVTRGTWYVKGHSELGRFWQRREDQNAWLLRELAAIPKGTPCVHFQHYRPGDSEEEGYELDQWLGWKAYGDAGLPLLTMFWAHSHRHGEDWLGNPAGGARAYGVDVGASAVITLRNKEYVPRGFFLVGLRGGKMWSSYELDGFNDSFRVVSADARGVVVNSGGVLSTATQVRVRSEAGDWQPLAKAGPFTWRAAVPANAGGRLHVEADTLGGKKLTADAALANAPNAAAPVPKPDAPWTGPGGNALNTSDVGASGKPPLRLAWVTNVGARLTLGGPVVEGGKVHVQLAQYTLEDRSGLVTLDAATGVELGFYDFSPKKLNRLTVLPLMFSDGALFSQYPYSNLTWGQGAQQIFAVDALNGKPLWSEEFVAPLAARAGVLVGTKDTAETVDGKRIPYRRLAAWSAKDGKGLWTSDKLWEEPQHYDLEWNGFEAPAIDVQGKRVYSTAACVSLDDGKTVWKHAQQLFFNPYVWRPTVAATDRRVLAHGCGWDRGTGEEKFNHARLEPEDARHKVLKWATLTAARNDVVVFAWADGFLQACEPETGKPLWEVKSGLPLFGGLAIMGDAVYAVSRAGVILGLDLKTGREVWRADIGIPILSYPAATGNTLFIADWSGNVYAFVGE